MEDKLQTTRQELIPFKALAHDKDKIKTQLYFLGVFLERLLTLQGETSKQRMKVMLPMMKDSAWSLSLKQVKDAFTMYVQGKLPIEPKTNFLDIILFNKVLTLYRQQMQRPKKQEHYTSPEEIEFIMTEAVDRVKKDYKQNGCITEMCHHVYDHLFEQGKLPKDKEYKDLIFKKAKSIRILELKEQREVSNRNEIGKQLDEINKDRQVIIIAKRLVLEDYFKPIQNTNK